MFATDSSLGNSEDEMSNPWYFVWVVLDSDSATFLSSNNQSLDTKSMRRDLMLDG